MLQHIVLWSKISIHASTVAYELRLKQARYPAKIRTKGINKKNWSGINDSYENKESVKEGEDPLKERIILFSRQMSLIY
jgi:hypothetical protein